VTQPLAIVFCLKILPGGQLVNRLQDLNYRVLTAGTAAELAALAVAEGPMLLIVDMDSAGTDLYAMIGDLRANPKTKHLPIVAFSANTETFPAAQQAGATLTVGETALLTHLSQFLEEALRV